MNLLCATTICAVILFAKLSFGSRIIYHSHDQFATTYLKHDENAVKITLFYETLCPYCINFIRKQLYPTNEKMAKYLNLDLVPYGNAWTTINKNGSYSFDCQHGEVECLGNKIHACVLQKYNSSTQTKIVRLFNCLAETSYKTKDIQKCCQECSFNYSFIESCISSSEADVLLAAYGDRTKQNQPEVKFVPFIMFNGYYNATLNEGDLMKTICQLLNDKPHECSTYNIV